MGSRARVKLPVVAGLPRASRRVVVAPPGQRPEPAMAVWELTLACDQACIHCGPRAGPRRADELTTDEALRLVDELAEIGVKEVVLIGGEAYLRDDCPLVIRRIRERGMSVTMATGGYNVDAALADLLAEAGLLACSLSIDGLEQTHDTLRGRPGSWRRAFGALANLRKAGIQLMCNSQVNARTLPDLLPLFDLLLEAGVSAWQLQLTVPHGRAADNIEILLQPWQMLAAFEVIGTILDIGERRNVRIWPSNSIGYFGPDEARLRRFVKPTTLHYSGCEAGTNVIAIESNGAIKSCPSLGSPDHYAGGWRDRSLREMWEQAPELQHLWGRTRDDLWGFCRECDYADICRGGCTAAAESLLGRPGNNPYCHHRALELDRQGLRERVELLESAPDVGFGAGRFRVVREAKDPARREREGPVAIEDAALALRG